MEEEVEDAKRYDCVCPSCNEEFWASLSILQLMGQLDKGHGSCPECKMFLNLTFEPDSEKMICIPWDTYLETKKVSNY